MKKDFITVTPDSGSGNTTITVVANENTGNARSTPITISGGGITRTINVRQAEGIRYASMIVNLKNPYNSDSDEWEWRDPQTQQGYYARYDFLNEFDDILEFGIKPMCDDCKIDILASDGISYATGISGDFNGVKFQNFNWDRRDVRKSGNISVGGITIPLIITENW